MGSLFARSQSSLSFHRQPRRLLFRSLEIHRTFRVSRAVGAAAMAESASKPVFFFDIDNCVCPHSSRDFVSKMAGC